MMSFVAVWAAGMLAYTCGYFQWPWWTAFLWGGLAGFVGSVLRRR